MTTAKTVSSVKLVDTEIQNENDSDKIDLFTKPLNVVRRLAQDFANEPSTQLVVDRFVCHLEF